MVELPQIRTGIFSSICFQILKSRITVGWEDSGNQLKVVIARKTTLCLSQKLNYIDINRYCPKIIV